MTYPRVLKMKFLDMQVCVPRDYSDAAIIAFAERENPCGTTAGWQITKLGDKHLAGSPERVQCEEHTDNCHVMLHA